MKEVTKYTYCDCGNTVNNPTRSKSYTIKQFERLGILIQLLYPMCGDCDELTRKNYKKEKTA